MKFLSRLFNKTPPPTEAEIQQKKDQLFDAFRTTESGRQMLDFIAKENIEVELNADMGKKKHGVYYWNHNKIYLNYHQSFFNNYSTLAHEIIHAVQDRHGLLYRDKLPTPYKALLIDRFSEAQAFAGGAKSVYEYLERLRKNSPKAAAKILEEAGELSTSELAYFNAREAGHTTIESTLHAFNAFFSVTGECKNYSQNVGYYCEIDSKRYLDSELKGSQQHYYISEEFLERYGEIYFGEEEHHNIFVDNTHASALNELYTHNIEDWVNQNMRQIEFILKLFYSNARDLCDHHGPHNVSIESDRDPNSKTTNLGHTAEPINPFSKVKVNPDKFDIRWIEPKTTTEKKTKPQKLNI